MRAQRTLSCAVQLSVCKCSAKCYRGIGHSVGMEVIAQLYFHAPRLIRCTAALAMGPAELRPPSLMTHRLSYCCLISSRNSSSGGSSTRAALRVRCDQSVFAVACKMKFVNIISDLRSTFEVNSHRSIHWSSVHPHGWNRHHSQFKNGTTTVVQLGT